MWGTPGTLIAARTMLERTGDERWRCGVAGECGGGLVAPRRGRPLDAASLGRVRAVPRARRTGWSGTCRRSGRCSTRSGAPRSSAIPRRSSSAAAFVEDGLANWPPVERAELPGSGRPDPAPVVLGRRAGDRHGRGRLPGRGAPARRSGAHLAGGTARAGEGPLDLPRHRRERLRVPEDVRAHRRRALAGARPALRHACARAGGAPAGRPRPRPVLALDGRPRRRALRCRLPRGTRCVPALRPRVDEQTSSAHGTSTLLPTTRSDFVDTVSQGSAPMSTRPPGSRASASRGVSSCRRRGGAAGRRRRRGGA